VLVGIAYAADDVGELFAPAASCCSPASSLPANVFLYGINDV